MTKVTDRFISLLEEHLGKSAVVSDPDIMEPYGRDESVDGPYPPDVVLRPQTPEQVRVALRLATEHRVPVTPRGAGTGKSGGALPIQGGAVISFEGMNKILDVDGQDLVALAEPGVITGHLQEAVEDQGLFYPPDPASLDSCTLGGNVAENAGGPRAVRYGVTGHYVLGLEVALMDGSKLEFGGRTMKDVAGYDLTSLVVGSEGTLAVMTRLNLRLTARPQAVAAAWAVFARPEQVGRAVQSVLSAGLEPRCLEFMNRIALEHGILEHSGFACEGEAALLVELDGHTESLEPRLAACAQHCEEAGADDVRLALDEAARRRLWKGRRQVATALTEAHPYKISEDIAVPVGRIPEMLTTVEDIGRKHGLEVAVFGHAGDGNLHVDFLADDPDTRREHVEPAIRELMVAAKDFGGTISAEHGVGTCKRRFMHLAFPPQELDLMRRIKTLWDPTGLLNPGKLLPDPDNRR
jgi:glycolate oxidase